MFPTRVTLISVLAFVFLFLATQALTAGVYWSSLSEIAGVAYVFGILLLFVGIVLGLFESRQQGYPRFDILMLLLYATLLYRSPGWLFLHSERQAIVAAVILSPWVAGELWFLRRLEWVASVGCWLILNGCLLVLFNNANDGHRRIGFFFAVILN